uniref:PCI domain-containing protein n=1 Tax=Neobodo designis TaxID=312471 RepID=A0A7S1Q8Y1_NEODS|mmetsp:Transcript_34704/g.107176  ORF Transcript_34704/g.107176 Transcript_34704/m.107176 type:complete len:240 (+) Transcript_34704:48-767(+)
MTAVADLVHGKPPAAAAALVKQELGRPSTYFFGQLYHTPEVQALKGQPVFEVVELFAYGTLADVSSLSAEAQTMITPNMTNKLKRLTLVSLAQHDRRLSYDRLFAGLQVDEGRELEDLVIDAITEGLLAARIDQRGRTVEVTYAAARDVKREAVGALKEALVAWRARCTSTVAELDALVQNSRANRDMQSALTKGIIDAESRTADECKKELLAREAQGLDDDEYAPGARGGAGGFRRRA